ncbi:MAG: beta-ketoacyl-ACP synthase I, partial [Pseudomonadota bacterium]|nr:beta-ketoacyl-ACP synthase I [Pseudomonadota bacterium]
ISESANIKNIDPNFEDLPIPQKRLDNVDLNYILSNSFGFGGTNASLVFKNPKT